MHKRFIERSVKKIMKVLICCFCVHGYQLIAQPETEVYLLSLKLTQDTIILGQPRNISSNHGYDNQPSFDGKDTLLFASTRKGQTDIRRYVIPTGDGSWLCNTPAGSEYSPLRIPGRHAVSAIRLDSDGKQLLYAYDLDSGESTALFEDHKVGYHLWNGPSMLFASVLTDDRMDLVVATPDKGSLRLLERNVGRSLHKIPGTDLISYISKTNAQTFVLMSLDPGTGTSTKIIDMPAGSEDVCWAENGYVLAASGKAILYTLPGSGRSWTQLQELGDPDIGNITRLAVNKEGTWLALVAD